MTIERFHIHADRYEFDFNRCKSSDGWAQVDTEQDASYFGTWANPFQLRIVTYVEGDVTVEAFASIAEFSYGIRRIKAWNDENGFRFTGIDPGFNESAKTLWSEYGLGDLLH